MNLADPAPFLRRRRDGVRVMPAGNELFLSGPFRDRELLPEMRDTSTDTYPFILSCIDCRGNEFLTLPIEGTDRAFRG